MAKYRSSSKKKAFNDDAPNLFDFSYQENTPFTGHQVAVLGRTSNMSNKEISSLFEELGAIVTNVPSKNVSLLFVLRDLSDRDSGLIENLEFNGYKLNILNEEDLNRIINGEYSDYKALTTPLKKIIIGNNHLQKQWYAIGSKEGINPLYHQTLFFPPVLKSHKEAIAQVLGNLGMMISNAVDEDTDIIMLTDENIKNIMDGKTDEDLIHIQDAYNNSFQINFTWRFSNFKDLIGLIEDWIDHTGDAVTKECYAKYQSVFG